MHLFVPTTVLLAVSFGIHLVLWRIAIPRQQILALVSIFAMAPIVVAALVISMGMVPSTSELSSPSIIGATIFYCSCAIVYFIFYSAIESESPTLLIISYIANNGDSGCDDIELRDYIIQRDALSERVKSLESGGFISTSNGLCALTSKGRFLAGIFGVASRLLGLPLGG